MNNDTDESVAETGNSAAWWTSQVSVNERQALFERQRQSENIGNDVRCNDELRKMAVKIVLNEQKK